MDFSKIYKILDIDFQTFNGTTNQIAQISIGKIALHLCEKVKPKLGVDKTNVI